MVYIIIRLRTYAIGLCTDFNHKLDIGGVYICSTVIRSLSKYLVHLVTFYETPQMVTPATSIPLEHMDRAISMISERLRDQPVGSGVTCQTHGPVEQNPRPDGRTEPAALPSVTIS